MKKLIIAGASGHGKVVADIAVKTKEYEQIVFLDDNPEIKEVMGFSVIGAILPDKRLFEMILGQGKVEVIIAIGNSRIRKEKQQMFEAAGIEPATLIHPAAVIGMDVQLGKGTVVMANAVVNSGSVVGDGCVVNTGATVDHDNQIEEYVHISVGSHLAGTVCVGAHTWIGAGAVVSNNISICNNCMIGAGAVVVKNIIFPGTYVGVPAQRIRE